MDNNIATPQRHVPTYDGGLMSNTPPKTFAAAETLIDSPELHPMLRQKLIYIAFTGADTVAFRAIELLLSQPRPEGHDELEAEDTPQLLNLLQNILEKENK